MADAMAIVGAVSGTVVIVNIIKTWIGELRGFLEENKKVGETLQKLEVSLISLEAKLSLWMQFWKLQEVRKWFKFSVSRNNGLAIISGIPALVHEFGKIDKSAKRMWLSTHVPKPSRMIGKPQDEGQKRCVWTPRMCAPLEHGRSQYRSYNPK